MEHISIAFAAISSMFQFHKDTVKTGANLNSPPLKDDGEMDLMFSQRNNPYCDLLKKLLQIYKLYVGCDLRDAEADLRLAVSIHAPTWGATRARIETIKTRQFQSTHPRGVRPCLKRRLLQAQRFQSTHPRGVRPQMFISSNTRNVFQSTHPRGVRRQLLQDIHIVRLFQSTHPRGVRLMSSICTPYGWKFQSTHPRGVRLPYRQARQTRFSFQSTHPRGVRR